MVPMGKESRRSMGPTSDSSRLVKTVVKNESIGHVNKYHLTRRVGCFLEASLLVLEGSLVGLIKSKCFGAVDFQIDFQWDINRP